MFAIQGIYVVFSFKHLALIPYSNVEFVNPLSKKKSNINLQKELTTIEVPKCPLVQSH